MLFRKRLLLSKVDISADSFLARLIQEAQQSNPFPNARATTNQYYEAGMRNLLGRSEEIIPVASDEYVIVLASETQHLFISCLWMNQLSQLENLVAQSSKAIGHVIRHIVIEKDFSTARRQPSGEQRARQFRLGDPHSRPDTRKLVHGLGAGDTA